MSRSPSSSLDSMNEISEIFTNFSTTVPQTATVLRSDTILSGTPSTSSGDIANEVAAGEGTQDGTDGEGERILSLMDLLD